MQIIECIPNFSEGRRSEVIETIVTEARNVEGVVILDVKPDSDHNRTVLTFAGAPEPVLEAAFKVCQKAAELIDLNQHQGEHPRMGATDVIPLVPLQGVSVEECVQYAEQLAERIATELSIPIYLYEEAAKVANRKNLAVIRRGQYEKIREEIATNSDRKPDYGPAQLGSAGITAVGVREALIAYNVNLGTDNLEVAKQIAFAVRHKNGGFRYVKAMGFALEDKGIVQVSMNLTNYKQTAVHHVFEMIKREAAMFGVPVLESEIIGLIPEAAITAAGKYYLQAHNFAEDQILERRLRDATQQPQTEVQTDGNSLPDFLAELASDSPAPGGGSVAALAGSLAASLGSMVANLTVSKKRFADIKPEMSAVLDRTESKRQKLYDLIACDAEAYKMVVAAYKAKSGIQESLKQAARIPMQIAETAISLVDDLELLVKKGNQNAITDCGVALYLLETAVKGAILNVKINLVDIEDEGFVAEQKRECQNLLYQLNTVRELQSSVEIAVNS